jgi:hypothetical protein
MMTEAELVPAEAELVAKIDAAIANMTRNGTPPQVEWIVQDLLRQHPPPPALPLVEFAARAGLRTVVRRRLGLPEESGHAEGQPLDPQKLREQAANLVAHADALARYAKQRRE